MGCGMVETHQHHIRRDKIVNKNVSILAKRQLCAWLNNVNTEPRINELLQKILGLVAKGNDGPFEVDITSGEDMHELVREQNKIGWLQVYKGRMTLKFREIQTRYYERNKKHKTERNDGLRWAKNLIKRMIYFSLLHWQVRNEWVHEITRKDNVTERKKKVNDFVIEWYNKRDEFDTDSDYLFKIPLLGRCMKSLKNKEAWIRTTELEYLCVKGKTV